MKTLDNTSRHTTSSKWPDSVFIHLPVEMSHTFILLSWDELIIWVSFKIFKQETGCLCPLNSLKQSCVFKSRSMNDLLDEKNIFFLNKIFIIDILNKIKLKCIRFTGNEVDSSILSLLIDVSCSWTCSVFLSTFLLIVKPSSHRLINKWVREFGLKIWFRSSFRIKSNTP